MIKIEYNMNTNANIAEIIGLFVAILDAIETDVTLKFSFEMAKRFRKDRDAKDNTGN